MPTSQLFPEVIDASTLGPKFNSPIYLPIGVEGQMDSAGSATVGQVKTISRPSESDDFFGPASSLGLLVKFLLGRGVAGIIATASAKGSSPDITARKAAWSLLESSNDVRIRLTDSTTQADLVALGTSCDYAATMNHKQFALGGLATGTSKANMLTAATAIGHKRFCGVGPGIYDENGILKSGIYAAAAVAAAVSQNPDPSDDLDTMTLPNLTDIEHDANGNPLFKYQVVAGTPVNDFEDLLQGGWSPLMPGRGGGVAVSHLRMTFTGDATFDALMTRIIVDQVFVIVRDYCYEFNYLRRGNTALNRELLRSGVEALLAEHTDWIQPRIQSDGVIGYNVAVVSSPDNHQMIVSYEGNVVRNTQTILVAGNLSIPA